MKKIEIKNQILLEKFVEVDNSKASEITQDLTDTRVLSGLILTGYEHRHTNKANENQEVFGANCLDKFIEDYYVANGLNMPLSVFHNGNDFETAAGVILKIENNTVGYKFTAYVPKTFKNYENLKNLLEIGYIQGFSKYGWATSYEYIYNADGTFSYVRIDEMTIIDMSLVACPANLEKFEKIIENTMKFQNDLKQKKSKIWN